MQVNYRDIKSFIFNKIQTVKIKVFLFFYIEPGEKTFKNTKYCKTAYTATSVIDGNLFTFKVRLAKLGSNI